MHNDYLFACIRRSVEMSLVHTKPLLSILLCPYAFKHIQTPARACVSICVHIQRPIYVQGFEWPDMLAKMYIPFYVDMRKQIITDSDILTYLDVCLYVSSFMHMCGCLFLPINTKVVCIYVYNTYICIYVYKKENTICACYCAVVLIGRHTYVSPHPFNCTNMHACP